MRRRTVDLRTLSDSARLKYCRSATWPTPSLSMSVLLFYCFYCFYCLLLYNIKRLVFIFRERCLAEWWVMSADESLCISNVQCFQHRTDRTHNTPSSKNANVKLYPSMQLCSGSNVVKETYSNEKEKISPLLPYELRMNTDTHSTSSHDTWRVFACQQNLAKLHVEGLNSQTMGEKMDVELRDGALPSTPCNTCDWYLWYHATTAMSYNNCDAMQ